MGAAWPTACLVHLPVHASWLKQIEIYLSHRATQNDQTRRLADLEELAARVLVFQDRYNTTAEPFDWHFGRKPLDRLLERLAIHEPLAA